MSELKNNTDNDAMESMEDEAKAGTEEIMSGLAPDHQDIDENTDISQTDFENGESLADPGRPGEEPQDQDHFQSQSEENPRESEKESPGYCRKDACEFSNKQFCQTDFESSFYR